MYLYFNYEVVFKSMFDIVCVYFYNGCFGTHTHTHTQNTHIHSSTSRSSSENRLLPSRVTWGKTAPGGNMAPRLICQTSEHKLTLNSGT